MPNTTGLLPYPAATDPVAQGAAAIQSLAVAIDARVYRKLTPKAVNNTVALTDLLNGEITLAAGALGINKQLRLSVIMDLLNTGVNALVPRFQLVLGGTVLLDTGTIGGLSNQWANGNVARRHCDLSAEIHNLGGSVQSHMVIRHGAGRPDQMGNAPFTVGNGWYYTVPNNTPNNEAFAQGWNTTAMSVSGALPLQLMVGLSVAHPTVEAKLYSALAELV